MSEIGYGAHIKCLDFCTSTSYCHRAGLLSPLAKGKKHAITHLRHTTDSRPDDTSLTGKWADIQ